MCVIYFVWYFSIFLLYFSKILATNIDSITSYSKIREEIKSMYVCMYVYLGPVLRPLDIEGRAHTRPLSRGFDSSVGRELHR